MQTVKELAAGLKTTVARVDRIAKEVDLEEKRTKRRDRKPPQ